MEKRRYYTVNLNEDDLKKVAQWASLEGSGWTPARALRFGLKLFMEKYIDGNEAPPIEDVNVGNKFQPLRRDEHGRKESD